MADFLPGDLGDAALADKPWLCENAGVNRCVISWDFIKWDLFVMVLGFGMSIVLFTLARCLAFAFRVARQEMASVHSLESGLALAEGVRMSPSGPDADTSFFATTLGRSTGKPPPLRTARRADTLMSKGALTRWMSENTRVIDGMQLAFQIVPSMLVLWLFGVRAVSRSISEPLFFVELVCNFLFLSIFLLRLALNPRAVSALLSLSSLVDLLSIGSFLALILRQCNWPVTPVGAPVWVPGMDCVTEETGLIARTWFSFGFLRAIYVRDLFDIIERLSAPRRKVIKGLESDLEINDDNTKSPLSFSIAFQMVRFMFKILAVMFVTACGIYILELLGELPGARDSDFTHLYVCSDGSITNTLSADCSDEGFSIFTAFYFVMVTLSTVGYGDFSPSTTMGRVFVAVAIVAGVVTFAQWASKIVEIARVTSVGRGAYDHEGKGAHVVVVGSPSVEQVREFLAEFMHENYSDVSRERVVFLLEKVGDEDPSSSRAAALRDFLLSRTTTLVYRNRVSYLQGSALNSYDLGRAAAEYAQAVFVLPDRFGQDPFKEDTANLSRVLSIRRYLSHVLVDRNRMTPRRFGLLITTAIIALAALLIRTCLSRLSAICCCCCRRRNRQSRLLAGRTLPRIVRLRYALCWCCFPLPDLPTYASEESPDHVEASKMEPPVGSNPKTPPRGSRRTSTSGAAGRAHTQRGAPAAGAGTDGSSRTPSLGPSIFAAGAGGALIEGGSSFGRASATTGSQISRSISVFLNAGVDGAAGAGDTSIVPPGGSWGSLSHVSGSLSTLSGADMAARARRHAQRAALATTPAGSEEARIAALAMATATNVLPPAAGAARASSARMSAVPSSYAMLSLGVAAASSRDESQAERSASPEVHHHPSEQIANPLPGSNLPAGASRTGSVERGDTAVEAPASKSDTQQRAWWRTCRTRRQRSAAHVQAAGEDKAHCCTFAWCSLMRRNRRQARAEARRQRMHNAAVANDIPVILMLRRSENKDFAISAGVVVENIVCADEINYALLGVSTLHKGVSSMVSNLVSSWTFPDADRVPPSVQRLLLASGNEVTPAIAGEAAWLAEYQAGAARRVSSFLLHEKHWYQAYSALCVTLFSASSGDVHVLGMDVLQPDGSKMMALAPPPNSLYLPGCNVYAIVSSAEATRPFSHDTSLPLPVVGDDLMSLYAARAILKMRVTAAAGRTVEGSPSNNVSHALSQSLPALRAQLVGTDGKMYIPIQRLSNRVTAHVQSMEDIISPAATLVIVEETDERDRKEEEQTARERGRDSAHLKTTGRLFDRTPSTRRLHVDTTRPPATAAHLPVNEASVGTTVAARAQAAAVAGHAGVLHSNLDAREGGGLRVPSSTQSDAATMSTRVPNVSYSSTSHNNYRGPATTGHMQAGDAAHNRRRPTSNVKMLQRDRLKSAARDVTLSAAAYKSRAYDRMLHEVYLRHLADLYKPCAPPVPVLHHGNHIVILCQEDVSFSSLPALLHSIFHTSHQDFKNCGGGVRDAHGTTIVLLHPRAPTTTEWAALLPHAGTHSRTDVEYISMLYGTEGGEPVAPTTEQLGALLARPDVRASRQSMIGPFARDGGVQSAALAGAASSSAGALLEGLQPKTAEEREQDMHDRLLRAARARAHAWSRHLYFVEGSSHSLHDLSCAGVLTAKRVIVLASASPNLPSLGSAATRASAATSAATDASSLFAVALLRSKLGRLQPQTIVELTYDASMAMLHDTNSSLLSSSMPASTPWQVLDSLYHSTGAMYLDCLARARLPRALQASVPLLRRVFELEAGPPRALQQSYLLNDLAINAIMQAAALASNMLTRTMGTSILFLPPPAIVTYTCAARRVRQLIAGQLGVQGQAGWPLGNVSLQFGVDKAGQPAVACVRMPVMQRNAPPQPDDETPDTFAEYAQGAATVSLNEKLLAATFYEPSATSIVKNMVSCDFSRIALISMPPILLAHEVNAATLLPAVVMPPAHTIRGSRSGSEGAVESRARRHSSALAPTATTPPHVSAKPGAPSTGAPRSMLDAATFSFATWDTVYRYLVENYGVTPLGIMRHAAHLSGQHVTACMDAAGSVARARIVADDMSQRINRVKRNRVAAKLRALMLAVGAVQRVRAAFTSHRATRTDTTSSAAAPAHSAPLVAHAQPTPAAVHTDGKQGACSDDGTPAVPRPTIDMSTVRDLMQRASTKRALLQVEATLPPLPDARTVACLVNDQRALSYSKAGDVHSARVLAHYYQHRLPAPHATLPTPLTADVGVDARSTLHTLFAHDAVPMVPGQADTAEARHARVVLAGHVYSVPELKAARTARTLGHAPSTPAQPLEPALLPFNYVYTAPEADTKVKADDLIIVMTSRANPYVCAVKMIQRWYRAITARTTPSFAPGHHTSARSMHSSKDCEERAAIASPLVDAPTAAPASVLRAAPPPALPPVPLHLFPPPRSSPPPAHVLHASSIVPANTPPTQEQWVGVASPTFSSAVSMQPMPASTSANQPHTV